MKITAPTVTVVIPCYNYGHYLAEAITSAFGQTVRPLEVVVVDDGSGDNTAAVARANGARLIQQENAGFSAARNAGARAARGELLVFLDADDVLDRRFLERCLSALGEGSGKTFVYTQWKTFGQGESTVSNWPTYSVERLALSNFIPISILIPRDAVLGHPFRTSLRHAYEDWDFHLTLAADGWTGVLVDEPLLNYRQHGAGAIATFHSDELLVRRTIVGIAFRHWKVVGPGRVWKLWREYQHALKSHGMERLRGGR